MDKISVTDEALRNSYVALQQLNDYSATITGQCVSDLTSLLSSLDSTFRKEIQRYIDAITELKQKLSYCIDENMAAVSERFSKIPDYENQTYKARNMV